MCKIFVFKEPLVTSLCSYLNAFKKMLIRQFGIFISVTSAIFRGAFVKFDYTSNLTKVFKSLSEKYFKMRSTHSLLRKCSMVEDEVNLSIKWLFRHIITSLSQYSTSSWSAKKIFMQSKWKYPFLLKTVPFSCRSSSWCEGEVGGFSLQFKTSPSE